MEVNIAELRIKQTDWIRCGVEIKIRFELLNKKRFKLQILEFLIIQQLKPDLNLDSTHLIQSASLIRN